VLMIRGAPLLTVMLTFAVLACAAPAAPAPKPAAPSAPAGAAPAAPSGAAPPAAGSAPQAPASAPAALAPLSPRVKIRLGVTEATVNGPMFIGMDRGYFAEQGLDVEDSRFDGVTRMMQPLAAGQLDVIGAAITAGLFNAVARDVDVRIVADRGRESPGRSESALVVRADLYDSGAVRSLANLRGLRVAVPGAQAGSTLALELGHGLEAQGMTIDDVEVVDLPIPEANAALGNRSVDAALITEPLVTQGIAAGISRQLHRSGELYPGLQTGFILYSADLARNQSEAARRFMVAYLRGVRDYSDAFTKNKGRDGVVGALMRQTAMKDPNVYAQMTPTYINPNGRLDPTTLIAAQDWFASRELIPRKIDVLSIVDPQFVDFALNLLGPYDESAP
jgi:NitT/TauT family transport system substrate-binding protein